MQPDYSEEPFKTPQELVSTGLSDNQKLFIEALDHYKGNVSASCRAVGISRYTFYQWRESSDRFKEEVETIRENAIDWVESKLMQNIEDGNVVAQIFYLKTIGRRRGYIEKYDQNLDANAEETELVQYMKEGQERVERMKRDSVVSEQ